MSYRLVINHIQRILNECGDPVILATTGVQIPMELGTSIELRKTAILVQNNCCQMPPPTPQCEDNPEDKYSINRIRISPSLADDYSKNHPYTDDRMKQFICSNQSLFGCYP
jgi:hypothetical protein